MVGSEDTPECQCARNVARALEVVSEVHWQEYLCRCYTYTTGVLHSD